MELYPESEGRPDGLRGDDLGLGDVFTMPICRRVAGISCAVGDGRPGGGQYYRSAFGRRRYAELDAEGQRGWDGVLQHLGAGIGHGARELHGGHEGRLHWMRGHGLGVGYVGPMQRRAGDMWYPSRGDDGGREDGERIRCLECRCSSFELSFIV